MVKVPFKKKQTNKKNKAQRIRKNRTVNEQWKFSKIEEITEN